MCEYDVSEKQAEIHDMLYNLGITAKYKGFYQTAYAIELCMESAERLLSLTKQVYPEVARRYGTNWKAVERNLRTVGSVIWQNRRPQLERLAQCTLTEKPCTAKLLSILSYPQR